MSTIKEMIKHSITNFHSVIATVYQKKTTSLIT